MLIAISESRRPRRNSVRYPVNAGFYIAIIMPGDRVVGGGPATAEFADHKSCEMAMSEVLNDKSGAFNGVRAQWATCVPKKWQS